MKRKIYDEFAITMQILLSDSASLKKLAQKTGRNILTFYQGADLSSLDLSNQDLTEMNFDRTNLKSTNISNSIYDIGAFNSSIVSNEFSGKIDEFDSYMSDINIYEMNFISIHARIREESLERCLDNLKVKRSKFAEMALIGTSTLKRAIEGSVISSNTWLSISNLLKSMKDDSNNSEINKVLSQPMVQILSQKQNGGFTSFKRSEMDNVINSMKLVINNRINSRGIDYNKYVEYNWRERPETILWVSKYYENFDTFPQMIFSK